MLLLNSFMSDEQTVAYFWGKSTIYLNIADISAIQIVCAGYDEYDKPIEKAMIHMIGGQNLEVGAVDLRSFGEDNEDGARNLVENAYRLRAGAK